jgi:hypothetical protein
MDKKDIFSIVIVIITAFIIAILIFVLPQEQRTLINIVSIFGSVTSPSGLLIAIIQLFKIRSSAQTYQSTFNKTLEKINNNSIISAFSRSIENIKLIKNYFDMNQALKTRPNFNTLMIDLLEIKNNEKLKNWKEEVDTYIQFCALTEMEIFQNILSEDKTDLGDKYGKLIEIEQRLSELQSIISKPQQD